MAWISPIQEAQRTVDEASMASEDWGFLGLEDSGFNSVVGDYFGSAKEVDSESLVVA